MTDWSKYEAKKKERLSVWKRDHIFLFAFMASLAIVFIFIYKLSGTTQSVSYAAQGPTNSMTLNDFATAQMLSESAVLSAQATATAVQTQIEDDRREATASAVLAATEKAAANAPTSTPVLTKVLPLCVDILATPVANPSPVVCAPYVEPTPTPDAVPTCGPIDFTNAVEYLEPCAVTPPRVGAPTSEPIELIPTQTIYESMGAK
jgi:hypothetical protein